MFDCVVLNIIFVLFPLLLYLIYIVYLNVLEKKGNKLSFYLAIISSIYLILKFSHCPDAVKIILLMLVSKEEGIFFLIVSLFISIYFNDFIPLAFYLPIYIICFILLKDRKTRLKEIVYLVCALIFIIVRSFYVDNYFYDILYLVMSCVFISMLNKLEKAVNLYGTMKNIVYEKEFKNSIFEISHEIKNPIAVCKGYLDMLNLNDTAKVNKYIPIVKEEINRTLVMLNDYMKLDNLSVDKDIMDVSVLLNNLKGSIEPLFYNKDIEVNYDISDEELLIDGDYDRLKQVLINIIKNSCEAVTSGGVISIKSYLKKSKVVIEIRDNGCGISCCVLNKLGHELVSTKNGCSGLGIKLSYDIVRLHNGCIRYKSKVGVGTLVSIELPIIKEKI